MSRRAKVEGLALGAVAVIAFVAILTGFEGLAPGAFLGGFGFGGFGFGGYSVEEYQETMKLLDAATGDEPDGAQDGQTVVFVTYGDGGERLVVAGLDGSPVRELVAIRGYRDDLGGPDISPDGVSVAYHVDPDSAADISWSGGADPRQQRANPPSPDLYVVPLAGGTPVRITTGDGIGGVHPAWGPNSRTIAYTCHFGRDGSGDICAIAPDGRGFRLLTDTPEVAEGHPTWSPDGSKVAFMAIEPGSARIEILEIATGKRTRVFPGERDQLADPAWSPDGLSIATAAGYLSQEGSICVRPLGDGSPVCHDGAPGGDWAPSWLPDGRLVFAGYLFDTEYQLLYVLDPVSGVTRWFVPGTGLQDLPAP